MTDTESSARMLTRTLATLACAFALVLAAVLGVMFAMVSNANQLEMVRQRERVEAALATQVHLRRLRFENLQAAGVLAPVLNSVLPNATLQWAFAQLANRFLDFDGTYLVTASGRVLAGVERRQAGTQADYGALLRLRPDLPGGDAPTQMHGIGNGPVRATLTYDGTGTVGIISADLRSPGAAAEEPGSEAAAFIVGHRKVMQAQLDELGFRYRVPRLEIVTERPAHPLLRRDIPSPDGSVRAWLSWTPERPGDAMISQFAWALGAVTALFIALFAYVLHRLRSAAQQIASRESQIQRLAGQDELSGLPNRRTFDLRLDQELAQLGRNKSALAVLMLDLDRFKAVNDTYGHNAGDELIRQVAKRLTTILRVGDTVARLGGDEFGIIQTHMDAPNASATLGQRILDALTSPFEIGGVAVTIGCSIGIAHAPQDGADRSVLLRLADTALYQAKNEGRNRYSFFEPQMNRALQLKRTVEEDLRNAIARDQLLLHYQPQVSIDGSSIIGVEALVRWPHPEHGLIPPSEFIGIAEERGLIVPLSEWVLRRACEQARQWPGIKLAVNVSPIQFRHKDFVASVIRILEETGFDPDRLELELTEGVVVEDADAAEAAMMDLRAHGVSLALDDFGTGYSSLIYLRRFAFDKIKIDRSFLEYMEATGESAILVHSVVHLGRALGLRVCAEGVETAEQHRFLQAIGCHELQGFLFSKGVLPEEIDRLLALDRPFEQALAA
ncbi:EAL domain-containing protein [Bosea vestrisii]|uniref:putative bifunctional diguanylate cyclase/phosphodiesterase n=1 Tax=Bosea vestrisii TaxID=151416 RepID=UPI0024E017A4|nr:EAL domain-containing protein [Bosea vestrisii]WID97467.1 EAL domain-containing protein [Bosea vestrisii]